jgi:transaldolase
MRLNNLKTKIFLDSGDPQETKEVLNLLGFLDGQTTNPTLISKNPIVAERIAKGEKLDQEEAFDFYREVAKEIYQLIPGGSISLEVYADEKTKAKEMLEQARELFSWIPNAWIKFPTTKEGIKAAQLSLKENLRVNMTLCFSQEQAAAIYSALKKAKEDQVFISPFVGRLDDRGENGMEVVKNILKMYRQTEKKIKVLTASVRKLDHLLYAIYLGSDIVTCPLRILKEWKEKNLILPDENFQYQSQGLKEIPYKELNLNLPWQKFNLYHPLTEIGLANFARDWKSLIK